MSDPVEVLLPVINRIEAKVDRVAEVLGARIEVVEGKLSFKNMIVSAVIAIATVIATSFAAGCTAPDVQFPSRQEMTRADKATVKVEGVDASGSWTGTGWFSAPDKMTTAGHVCEEDALFSFTDYKGQPGLAYPVMDSDTDPYDICTMQVVGYEPTVWLETADTKPKKWDPVYYVGYPNGELTVQDGYVVGYQEDYLRVAIAAYPGASGSALLNTDGEVVGVLSRFYPYDFNNFLFAPTDI